MFQEGAPRLDVAAPVRPGPGARAVLYARFDARETLAEITRGWPVPSETGEAAIARLDGDAAFFVTDPRFLPGWAFTRRIPVRSGRGIAVGVQREGISEGIDFRGTPVLVASHRLAGSDLFMITRMDLAELEEPLLRPLELVGAIVVLLLALGGVGIAWAYREDRLHAIALHRTRRELEASEQRLRLAIEGTHWVWEWDLEAGVLSADPEWARQAGLPYDRVTGDVAAVLAKIVHPDDRPYVAEALLAHVRGRSERFEAEFRTRLPVGERWLRLRAGASERGSDGVARRLVGVLTDTTDQRTLQAQLERSERMASLGTLAAGVAHEINNPLTYVVSNLDALEQGLPGGRTDLAEAARQAKEGIERVREVVRGLRSFSRGGTSRGPVDVAEELEAAVRIARNEIQHRATLEVDIGELPRVDAKGRELGQVFLNLLVNAGQAFPEGEERRGRVVVRAHTDAEGRARIEIADDGVGIPPEVLPRIFEPFFTTKPLGVGTGLGLAIAHNVVTASGGTISAESQLGLGTTFRVLLPPARPRPAGDETPPPAAGKGTGTGEHALVPPRPPPPAPPPAPAAAPAPTGTGPAVLVVDDEPLVARSIARALGPDLSVSVVNSAEDARRRLEGGERFAAIVCDLMMPGMTGMDLHDWVTANDPFLAARFVFVTGGAFTERSRAFLERTQVACVEKPFEPARLREVVHRAARQV
ncbi:MAG: ATP-binding protein [Anaeromyxobacteraceae bacterium]